MTYIDPYFIRKLFVLDLYDNANLNYPGYDIYEYSYGNLAQTIRVIPPTRSIYFNTTLPASISTVTSPNRLQWDITDGSSYMRYRENDNATNNV